jgi:hypothetical protein
MATGACLPVGSFVFKEVRHAPAKAVVENLDLCFNKNVRLPAYHEAQSLGRSAIPGDGKSQLMHRIPGSAMALLEGPGPAGQGVRSSKRGMNSRLCMLVGTADAQLAANSPGPKDLAQGLEKLASLRLCRQFGLQTQVQRREVLIVILLPPGKGSHGFRAHR